MSPSLQIVLTNELIGIFLCVGNQLSPNHLKNYLFLLFYTLMYGAIFIMYYVPVGSWVCLQAFSFDPAVPLSYLLVIIITGKVSVHLCFFFFM